MVKREWKILGKNSNEFINLITSLRKGHSQLKHGRCTVLNAPLGNVSRNDEIDKKCSSLKGNCSSQGSVDVELVSTSRGTK